jgi:hypothetical protein
MKYWLLLFVLLLFFQCNENNKKKHPQSSKDLVKAYYKSGKLRAEIPQKDKKKHGQAREFYESGKKFQEIDYKQGVKDGWARRYYENGELFQETPYKVGKIHGIQKKYRENGKLMSEATFFEDEPCAGLKEYLLDGSLKKKYPQIVISPIDQIRDNGLYIVRLTLTQQVKEVEYYTGSLTNNQYIGPQAKRIWNTDRFGVGEIQYSLLRGTFIMEKVNVIAKIKTTQGNYLISQRTFNVAADNRY